MTAPRKPRAPGRPVAAERRADPREALLDAAQVAFSRGGFGATSLRQIAQAAHVTPALASYYFGDKAGVLAAVIEQRVAPVAQEIGGALQGGTTAVGRLEAFVHAYTAAAARNPWLPQLILREVLSEGGVLRETFVSRFGGGLGGLLRATLAQAQQERSLRRDLDTAHLAMSLMALCVFPFIATPLVSGVLGIRVDAQSATAIAAHHWSLFLHGAEEAA